MSSSPITRPSSPSALFFEDPSEAAGVQEPLEAPEEFSSELRRSLEEALELGPDCLREWREGVQQELSRWRPSASWTEQVKETSWMRMRQASSSPLLAASAAEDETTPPSAWTTAVRETAWVRMRHTPHAGPLQQQGAQQEAMIEALKQIMPLLHPEKQIPHLAWVKKTLQSLSLSLVPPMQLHDIKTQIASLQKQTAKQQLTERVEEITLRHRLAQLRESKRLYTLQVNEALAQAERSIQEMKEAAYARQQALSDQVAALTTKRKAEEAALLQMKRDLQQEIEALSSQTVAVRLEISQLAASTQEGRLEQQHLQEEERALAQGVEHFKGQVEQLKQAYQERQDKDAHATFQWIALSVISALALPPLLDGFSDGFSVGFGKGTLKFFKKA